MSWVGGWTSERVAAFGAAHATTTTNARTHARSAHRRAPARRQALVHKPPGEVAAVQRGVDHWPQRRKAVRVREVRDTRRRRDLARVDERDAARAHHVGLLLVCWGRASCCAVAPECVSVRVRVWIRRRARGACGVSVCVEIVRALAEPHAPHARQPPPKPIGGVGGRIGDSSTRQLSGRRTCVEGRACCSARTRARVLQAICVARARCRLCCSACQGGRVARNSSKCTRRSCVSPFSAAQNKSGGPRTPPRFLVCLVCRAQSNAKARAQRSQEQPLVGGIRAG